MDDVSIRAETPIVTSAFHLRRWATAGADKPDFDFTMSTTTAIDGKALCTVWPPVSRPTEVSEPRQLDRATRSHCEYKRQGGKHQGHTFKATRHIGRKNFGKSNVTLYTGVSAVDERQVPPPSSSEGRRPPCPEADPQRAVVERGM